ncbi:hypothetical protein BDN70DRAFT_892362 [Pholiota conissans]|uniref:Uncharacterized protein n=1 Tax=Pholiota conissans TaxID=109636 RepID=A0A9P5Z9N3_9AGAR|nr:hypothetical protein BDN70DRAFT_892362 [Pholiota conissans]
MANAELISALQLPEAADDEEIAAAIVSLLISAVHDLNPRKSLSDIYHIITNLGGTTHLDPLNALPVLLPYNDPAARNIISVIGECGSAKEVVMAVQEAVERLQRTLETEKDEEEAEEETKATEGAAKTTTPVGQLLILVGLYASAVPRMKLRRKSAANTIEPFFGDLEETLHAASPLATKAESRSIISGISNLSSSTLQWVLSNTDSNEDIVACKIIISKLLNRSLLSFNQGINTDIAQRTLEEYYPRLAFRSRRQSADFSVQSSASHLVFYAYRPPEQIDIGRLLSFILPILISSVQTNTFLDESLAILIRSLHKWSTGKSPASLPHEITLPLCGILPSLASAHPDPAIRHQVFRVLSLLLSTSEPQLRFQHLIEYTRDSEFPQMRVAAVGLVKEALLQSLSNSVGKGDPFRGPLFLRSFGPILFRPNPPDLFSDALSLSEFQETPEPGRLVECLSLYYIVLQRDQENVTGIRDRDVIQTIENNLLKPLRQSIERWTSDPAISSSHLHDITPIVSLKISLERVDAARALILA